MTIIIVPERRPNSKTIFVQRHAGSMVHVIIEIED